MKVALRKRNQGGKISLYLDYFVEGERKREFLKLYLNPKPGNAQEKDLNRQTLQLAETIRAQRQIEIQSGHYGFKESEKAKGSFIAYMEAMAEQRKDSKSNYGNWLSAIRHFKIYAKKDVSLL